MMFMISADLSLKFKDSKRPVRILRLLMRARMGVSSSKVLRAESRVAMTSAS